MEGQNLTPPSIKDSIPTIDIKVLTTFQDLWVKPYASNEGKTQLRKR